MTQMQKTKQTVLFLTIGALVIVMWFLTSKSFIFEPVVERDTIEVFVPASSDQTAAPIAYDPTIAVTVPKTGWKTYSNSEYGFAFEYPPEYTLSVDTQEEARNTLFSLSVSKNKKPLPNTEAPDENSPFFLSVEQGNLSDGLRRLTNSNFENISVKTISLNGVPGNWVSMEYGPTSDLENYILLERNERQSIRIHYYQYSGNNSPMLLPNTVFDTVLQSVRPYP